MKLWISLALISFAGATADAYTFSKVEGVYQIQSCQSLSVNGQESLCSYDTVVVYPTVQGTVIYFKNSSEADLALVRSFGFPVNVRNLPNAHYSENGSYWAFYANSTSDLKESTRIEKQNDGSYDLSISRESKWFGSQDRFELNLVKIGVRGKSFL